MTHYGLSYKFMRTTVEESGALVSYLKGAPEVILQRSRLSVEERRIWEEKADRRRAARSSWMRSASLSWGCRRNCSGSWKKDRFAASGG